MNPALPVKYGFIIVGQAAREIYNQSVLHSARTDGGTHMTLGDARHPVRFHVETITMQEVGGHIFISEEAQVAGILSGWSGPNILLSALKQVGEALDWPDQRHLARCRTSFHNHGCPTIIAAMNSDELDSPEVLGDLSIPSVALVSPHVEHFTSEHSVEAWDSSAITGGLLDAIGDRDGEAVAFLDMHLGPIDTADMRMHLHLLMNEDRGDDPARHLLINASRPTLTHTEMGARGLSNPYSHNVDSIITVARDRDGRTGTFMENPDLSYNHGTHIYDTERSIPIFDIEYIHTVARNSGITYVGPLVHPGTNTPIGLVFDRATILYTDVAHMQARGSRRPNYLGHVYRIARDMVHQHGGIPIERPEREPPPPPPQPTPEELANTLIERLKVSHRQAIQNATENIAANRRRAEQYRVEFVRLGHQITNDMLQKESLERGLDEIGRDAASLASSFTRLIEHPRIERVEADGEALLLQTRPLLAMDDRSGAYHLIGAMHISINMSNGDLRFFNQDRKVDAMAGRMNAPHVWSNGEPCQGNFADISSQLAHDSDWISLAMMSLSFIESANTSDSAGKYVHYWPFVADPTEHGYPAYHSTPYPFSFDEEDEESSDDDEDHRLDIDLLIDDARSSAMSARALTFSSNVQIWRMHRSGLEAWASDIRRAIEMVESGWEDDFRTERTDDEALEDLANVDSEVGNAMSHVGGYLLRAEQEVTT